MAAIALALALAAPAGADAATAPATNGAATNGAATNVTAGAAGISAAPGGAENPAAVEGFWTPARIEAAPPAAEVLGLDGEQARSGDDFSGEQAPSDAIEPKSGSDVPSASLDPVPFSTAGGIGSPTLFASSAKGTVIGNPAAYPHRVHGKLVGQFEGVGTFGCSATVVSSGSGSLLVSAGHCAYDAQAGFARNLAFAPGYSRDSTPYGIWPVSNVIIPNGWAKAAMLDYDVSLMRVATVEGQTLQGTVGSRGIAFHQPRKQGMKAFGYPAKGSKRYDATKLVKCSSGYVKDPARNGGPRSVGMRCDMKQGASGGGWVAQNSFLVSETSHGYPEYSKTKMFGPYFGGAVRSLYTAKQDGWPSTGPVRCQGKAATIIGSDARDKIKGTDGDDVIATLGGNDVVTAGKGSDRICGGAGNDVIKGNADNDRLDGGPGRDKCLGGKGKNKFKNCEIRRG